MKYINQNTKIPLTYAQPLDMGLETTQGPFNENEVLKLQDTFLTNGIHYIKTTNIQTGRMIIETFLHSLPIYTEIACLSMHENLDTSVIDMYCELLDNYYLNSTDPKNLEEFFIDQCFIDFMWIEASQELLNTSWFPIFEKNVHDFKLCQTMPIIIMMYEDQ